MMVIISITTRATDNLTGTAKENEMSVYTDNGYKDRKHYLSCLAEDNGVDYSIVKELADLLGPTEDFDGLVTAVQDAVKSCAKIIWENSMKLYYILVLIGFLALSYEAWALYEGWV